MTELSQVVDRNDQPLGTKPRTDITSKDIYRVSALWVENSHSEVLLAQRSLAKKNSPGRWGPAVAGTVEAGESYEENIYKEAEEEIGLRGVPFAMSEKVYVESDEHRFFSQWYRATLDWPIEKFTIQEQEVAQLKWISKPELLDDIARHPESYTPSSWVWKDRFL